MNDTNIGLADVLDHGRGLIEEHGWIQHDFFRSGSGYCALGACDAAIDGLTGALDAAGMVQEGDWQLYEHLRRDIRLLLNPHCSQLLEAEGFDTDEWIGVTGWNDHPDRTRNEVLDMLAALATAVRDG